MYLEFNSCNCWGNVIGGAETQEPARVAEPPAKERVQVKSQNRAGQLGIRSVNSSVGISGYSHFKPSLGVRGFDVHLGK